MQTIVLQLILAILIDRGSGASDFDVERVRSPYVEARDVGQMMESGSSQGRMHKIPSGGFHSHSSFGGQSRPCFSCQYRSGTASSLGTGAGIPSGGSAYSSSNSYSSFSGMGGFPSQPLASSSRHEIKKEQEFVNGQQVYDFHHEKKYQDGKLVDEKRYENAPDDVSDSAHPGPYSYPSSYPSGGTTNAFSSSQSQFNVLPQSSYHQNKYQKYGIDHSIPDVDNFSEQFESEVERLREELRRKTLSHQHQPIHTGPTYGGSHKTEFRTQTKYVNGKPVYILNEERKYKDGKLVHNVTEEKGPEDLGVPGVSLSSPVLSSPTGGVYSSNQQEVRSQSHSSSQYPHSYPSSYPSYYSSDISNTDDTTRERPYRPSSYGYSSDVSASSLAYPSGPGSAITETNSGTIASSVPSGSHVYHRPSSVYSTETREEHRESQTQTSGNYHSNDYPNTRNQHNSDLDSRYRPSQTPDSYGPYYHRPEANYYPAPRPQTTTSTTTTTTTARPRYSGYDYSSSYKRNNLSPSYNQVSSQYDKHESTNSAVYSHNRPVATTQGPYYIPSSRRNPYDDDDNDDDDDEDDYVPENTYDRTSPLSNSSPYGRGPNTPATEAPYREPYSSHVSSENKIKEVSQSSYYESKSRPYNSGVYSTSTQEGRPHGYYPNQRNPQTPGNDDDVNNRNRSPTDNVRTPEYARGPGSQDDEDEHKEQERYDISPYDDASDRNEPENYDGTRRVQFENYPSHNPNTGHGSSYSSSNTYEESRRRTVNPSTPQDTSRQNPSHANPMSGSTQRGYSTMDSTQENRLLTTNIPTKWVEITITSKYVNGKLASQIQHHKYYENGIFVHENTTRKTRDELNAEGVNVYNLDLTPSELAQYGSTYSTSTHSQKHESHQIKRFRNGKQIYELNEEKRYQDGRLVHEDRDEKDEDDFPISGHLDESNYHLTQSHNMNHQLIGGGDGIHSQVSVSHPQTYSRRHEVRQEEEFLNGQKVYDLHHERKFQDGTLVHENKTELGPDNLGTYPGGHRDAMREILSGNSLNSIGQSALMEQKRVSDQVLSTSCLTCGHAHSGSTYTGGSPMMGTLGVEHTAAQSQSGSTFTGGSTMLGTLGGGPIVGHTSSHSQGGRTFSGGSTMLGTLGVGPVVGHTAGSTFRQDLNVEEHYENGQLVKGRKEDKKWIDGKLVDANEQHYSDGPSRTNLTLASGYGSGAGLSSGSHAHSVTTNGGCTYNYCLNGARCKSSPTGPVCLCRFGFRGSVCEEAYCPSRYCRFGGSCSVENGKQECRCTEGYSGYRCSTKYQTVQLGVSG